MSKNKHDRKRKKNHIYHPVTGSMLTKHHLVPKIRVKSGTHKDDWSVFEYARILHLWRDKHDSWHLLFGNLTLSEIIKVLERIRGGN